MRPTALLLLALALTALPLGQAQPVLDEPYQVRAAVGDIPTTPTVEASGSWNVEQSLKVQFDNASADAERTYHFTLPTGATLANATCDCARATHSEVGTALTFRIEPQTASGERTIRIVTRQAASDVVGFALPEVPDVDGVLILYVPTGSDPSSSVDLEEVGLSTNGQSVIHYGRFDGSGSDGIWAAIHPATGAAPSASGGDDDDAAWMEWLVPALVGLVLGAILWAVLVSRGMVQTKSRRQVAGTAAHVEAAAADPPAVLEGKKRALLAALKEIELAKQANEMPVEVYDVVKADLKKQAVTVMRALETSGGESKS